LNNSDIEYFFVDSHGILNSEIVEENNKIGLTTNFGYNLESGVSVFGRNTNTSRQVWDARIGYPGNEFYREFHKKDHTSGLHYHRVTSKSLNYKEKELYDIEKAKSAVNSDAHHFISLITKEVDQFSSSFDERGIVILPTDFELYGHWWAEGVDWVKKIIEIIYIDSNIEMISISDYISKFKEKLSIIKMKESSWGEGGDFRVWKNPEHGWIWPYINGSIKEFEDVLKLNPHPNEWERRILNQIARELLLMQGSDWPFLLYTKQAKEYANQRFHHHHQRFLKLIWGAKNFDEKTRISLRELEEFESIDSCFQEINIDYFRKK